MFIIVGLGNPGKDYENTRHNVGFDAIDELVDKYNVPESGTQSKAKVGKGVMDGQKILLAKPLTFMNLSGEAVRGLVDYYKVDPESELLIIYDDISLEPGNIRIRKKGSAGGHNGIKSIIAAMAGTPFVKIGVGIGRPLSREPSAVAKYVLKKMSPQEQYDIENAAGPVIEALREIADGVR